MLGERPHSHRWGLLPFGTSQEALFLLLTFLSRPLHTIHIGYIQREYFVGGGRTRCLRRVATPRRSCP